MQCDALAPVITLGLLIPALAIIDSDALVFLAARDLRHSRLILLISKRMLTTIDGTDTTMKLILCR